MQQFHDGLGFLTNHGLLSNTFEFSLQQVNPKLTLPYWDFTIESSSTGAAAFKDLDDVFGSTIKTPLFQDSWFGTTDPETNMVRCFRAQCGGSRFLGGVGSPCGLALSKCFAFGNSLSWRT